MQLNTRLATAITTTATAVGTAVAVMDRADAIRARVMGVHEAYARRRRYVVHVPLESRLYRDTHQWLAGLPSVRELRVVRPMIHDEGTTWIHDASGMRGVWMGRHRIHYCVQQPGAGEDRNDRSGRTSQCRIVIRTESRAALLEVQEILAAMVEDDRREIPLPRVRIWKSHGWMAIDAPLRPLESVSLDEGVKEDLAAHIRRFLDSEQEYVRRGLSWHLGLLLHGQPGTGKTSLAKGLAQEFGMDLAYTSLSNLTDDLLQSRMSAIDRGTIVLLEDIDTCPAATRRQVPDGPQLTMMGLLNLLDGVYTPHGVVIILTTNNPRALDPAIVRSGRADRHIHLGPATGYQVNDMYRVFYGRPPTRPFTVTAPVIPADVTEIFKTCLHDPGLAEARLHAMLAAAVAA